MFASRVRLHSLLRHLLPIALVVLGALLGAVVFHQFDRRVPNIYFDEHFFAAVDNSLLEENGQWKPNFGSGSMSLHRNVQYNDMVIAVHVTTYLASLPDSELIRLDRTIADSRYWRLTETTQSSELMQEKVGSSSKTLLVESIDRRTKLVVMYWFDVGGSRIGSRLQAKIYGLLNFFKFREDSSVVVLASECEVSCDGKVDSLRSLASRLFLDADGDYQSIVREAEIRQ